MMEEISMLPCPFCGNTQIDYWDETDGFYYCEKCGLCGPRAHDKILAADRWNGLPRRLKWTREKPTQEGWYWLKEEGRHAVVKMTAGGMISEPYVRHVNEVDGEWAGPIPEPEAFQ